MIELIEKLVDALREELTSYGEMLALLDRQQESLLARASDEVSLSINLVKAQGTVIQEARRQREDCRREVAVAVSLETETGFAELIPLAPGDYRPLLQALVDENNELLSRVRRRAAQNHTAMERAVTLMGHVLDSLRLSSEVSIGNGRVKLPARWLATRPLHEETN